MASSKTENVVIMDHAETLLRIIAKIIFFIGMFVSLICLVSIFRVNNSIFPFAKGPQFHLGGLVIAVVVAFCTVFIYAILNVISNISAKLSIIAAHYDSEEEDVSE